MSLGDDVRAAIGTGPEPARRTRQRARFVAEARGGRRWLKELAIGALAAGIGAGAVAVVWQQRAPAGLEPPVFEGNAFVFNEASQVYVEPGAQAHVEKASAREAIVVLEKGELTCSITSGRKNIWRFRAGANEVVVRGTKFSMLWKPSSESLDVQVTEGKVEVHTSDGQLRYVTAGDRLSWTKPAPVAPVPDEHADVVQIEDEEPAVREVEPAPVAAKKKVAAVTPRPEVVEPQKQPELRPLVPEWKRQAEAGRYAKAVALVEEQGLEGAMQTASSDDLLLFADAARLARKAGLGRSTLASLRTRFKGTADAAEAAFRLGRLEFDAGALADAGQWFDTYVREAPEGPFIAEAMGRRLDAWQRASDPRSGRAAQEYLARFPKGAYGALAKQVIGGQ